MTTPSPSWPERRDRLLQKAWMWLAIPTGIFVLEILRERTYVAWVHGPVMVGFGMAHSLFGLLLGSAVSFMVVWLGVTLFVLFSCLFRQQRVQRFLVRRLAFTLVGLLSLAAPFGTWESLPVLIFGTGHQSAALMIEAGENHSRLLAGLLLNKGVEINVRSEYQSTALIQASDDGPADFLLWLLDRGADPNASDYLGRTPLIQAVKTNDIQGVQLLLSSRADPKHQDSAGRTALEHAVSRGDSAIINVIKAALERQPI